MLIDTSAWIRHFRAPDPFIDSALASLIELGHPDVVGELAMGTDPDAAIARDAVRSLPSLDSVSADRTLELVQSAGMNGHGIGWTDACLLAACIDSVSPIAIYTLDRRMDRVARRAGIVSFGA